MTETMQSAPAELAERSRELTAALELADGAFGAVLLGLVDRLEAPFAIKDIANGRYRHVNPRMATLVWQLRFNFDLIVIDAPPIGRLADAAILAGMADSTIVISRVGRTKKADLVSAVEALKRTPTPIAGVVVFERRSLDSAYYPAGGSPDAVDLEDLRPVAPLAAQRRAKRS